jgi:FkbM family methyltransferase
MNVGRSLAGVGPWQWVSSGAGYHLDNAGAWLLEHAPALGRLYVALLKPPRPTVVVRPGWRFAEEYYDKREWYACRRGALWEAARRKGLVVPVMVPWLEGTDVQVTLGNDNSLCLYVCGSFEPNEFVVLDRLLKPGMVFIDVGANDGYYTMFAARRVGSGGQVVAVEPSRRECAHLARNLYGNGIRGVIVVPAALAAAPGRGELKLAHGFHSGHNSLGTFAHDDVAVAATETVRVDTLDNVVKGLQLERVDFIKIDVEGSELSVVRGAQRTLSGLRPALLFEVNNSGLVAQGHSSEALLNELQDGLGYRIYSFSNETGHLVPWAKGSFTSSNVLGIPCERRDLMESLGVV